MVSDRSVHHLPCDVSSSLMIRQVTVREPSNVVALARSPSCNRASVDVDFFVDCGVTDTLLNAPSNVYFVDICDDDGVPQH